MRKIIPLIVLMLLSVLFTMAQNLNPAEADKALQLVDANKASIGLSADVRSSFVVSSTFEDQVTGTRYVYLLQAYKGIPVFNQMLVLSFKNGKLSTKSGVFDPEIERLVNVPSGSPAVTAESAVQSALSDRGFRASGFAIALNRKDQGRFVEFGNMGISQQNITAQLMWVPTEDISVATKIASPATDVATSSAISARYKLAWQVYIIPKTTSDYWLVRVNAADNSILGNTNLTDYDNWGDPNENTSIKYPDFAMGKNTLGEGQKDLFDINSKDAKTNDDPSLVSNATYRVIPIPFEAPSFMPGASTTWHAIRSNPWTNATVANATTLNWHTGAAATDYDYSRGNNVWAYQDRTPSNNTGSIAKSASSTTPLPTLTFDFTPDYTLEPTVTTPPNQQFNITNLFYWNNLIHDIFYGYGFTEVGGNFRMITWAVVVWVTTM
ncbi:MAG: M36 family metallopeptidase [Chitinophagaceae bacterium]|nr:M36 family metallopeptidase [Chitinophagaceae bacterium]